MLELGKRIRNIITIVLAFNFIFNSGNYFYIGARSITESENYRKELQNKRKELMEQLQESKKV